MNKKNLQKRSPDIQNSQERLEVQKTYKMKPPFCHTVFFILYTFCYAFWLYFKNNFSVSKSLQRRV